MKKKRDIKKSALQLPPKMRPSVLGWIVLLAPCSVILFLLFFGNQIPFLMQQSSKESRQAAENLWRFGQEKMHTGDFQNAYLYFSKALKIRPDLAEAYISIAQILYLKGEITKAIETLNQAISLNPPQKDLALSNLAILYAQKGDYQTALEIFQRVLNIGIALEQIYDNMGTVYMNLRNFSQATEMYRLALESRPSMSTMYREMLFKIKLEYQNDEEYAEAWKAANDQFEKGVPSQYFTAYDEECVKEYARTKSYQATLLFRLGLALEMQGDLTNAENSYLQSLKLNSASADLNYRLGCLYLKSNDYNLAQRFLENTLRLNRFHQEAASLLKQIPSVPNNHD